VPTRSPSRERLPVPLRRSAAPPNKWICQKYLKERYLDDDRQQRLAKLVLEESTEYIRQEPWQVGLECLREMEHAGVKPDAVAVTAIIKKCGRASRADKAQQVFEWMVSIGVTPDASTFNALISAWAQVGTEQMRRAYDRARGAGFRPDVVTCNTLISIFTAHGQVRDALSVFGEMSRWRIEPDRGTFNSTLSACAKWGLASKAMRVHRWMQDDGFSPNFVRRGESTPACFARSPHWKPRRQIPTPSFMISQCWT
jgi:pentatricopeptide repeat protein